MPEPTSTSTVSLAALAVAMLGPMAGPYALIVFAALAGSLWPISSAEATSRVSSAFLLIRCTMMAVVFAGGAAELIQARYAVQAHSSLAPVAFFIGALGNGWRAVISSIGDALRTVIGRLGSSGGEKP